MRHFCTIQFFYVIRIRVMIDQHEIMNIVSVFVNAHCILDTLPREART